MPLSPAGRRRRRGDPGSGSAVPGPRRGARPRPPGLPAALLAVAALAAAGAGPAAQASGPRGGSVSVLRPVTTAALGSSPLVVRVRARRPVRRVTLSVRVAGDRALARRTFRTRPRRNLILRWRLPSRVAAGLTPGSYEIAARLGAGRRAPLVRGVLTVVATPAQPPADAPPAGPPPPTSPDDPVIAAAGDIACPGQSPDDPGNGIPGNTGICAQALTGNLITQLIHPAAVLEPGDIQYDIGALASFNAFYDPYWGQFKGITYPINGFAHDSYGVAPGDPNAGPGNGGYYAYFHESDAASKVRATKAQGSYSFDVGSWHIIALNSACGAPNVSVPCDYTGTTSWLESDLRAHPNQCTLAYTHVPRWSSPTAQHEEFENNVIPWYRLLYQYGADVVIGGENHVYERYAPQSPYTDTRDDAYGLTQFVAGTGGMSHYLFSSPTLQPNEITRDDTTFGVLALTLHPTSFSFRFVPVTAIAGVNPAYGTYSDAGGPLLCHGAPTA